MKPVSSVISLDDAKNKKQIKNKNIHFQRVICFSIPVECEEDLEHLDEVGKEELQISLGEKVDSIYGDGPFPTDPDDVSFFDDWHLDDEDTTHEPIEYVFRGIDGKMKLGELVPPTTKCVLNYYQTTPYTLNGLTKDLMREHFFLSGSMQSMKTLWNEGKIDEICKYLVKFEEYEDKELHKTNKENMLQELHKMAMKFILEKGNKGGTFILCDVKHFQTLFEYQGEEIVLGPQEKRTDD